jgi:hypothetical protein
MESSALPLPPREEIKKINIAEKQELPPLPISPEDSIKNAILDSSPKEETEEEIVNLPPSEKVFKTIELEEWTPNNPPSHSVPRQNQIVSPVPTSNISPFPTITAMPSPAPSPVQTIKEAPISPPLPKPEPQKESHSEIYIKIDKFYSAKRALSATEEKLEEIDELLKKIRETKLREEQELSAWEKELLSLKTRIKEVTSTLSEKA